MKIIDINNKITLEELKEIAKESFGQLIKGVVDVERGIMVIDIELHSDGEKFLLENNSRQENIWGINIYPFEVEEKFIEFDSMINLRPSLGNLSRGVDDPVIREKIKIIVNKLIKQ